MFPRLAEHLLRLGEVARHARLGEDMLPRPEGGDTERVVQVGPGPDHHGVHVGSREDFAGAGRDPLEAPLLRDRRGRRLGAVADGDEFHAGHGLEPRQVPLLRDATRTDDTEAYMVHGLPRFMVQRFNGWWSRKRSA